MARLTKKQAQNEVKRQQTLQQLEALFKISKDCISQEAQSHIDQAIKILENHPLITGIEEG